ERCRSGGDCSSSDMPASVAAPLSGVEASTPLTPVHAKSSGRRSRRRVGLILEPHSASCHIRMGVSLPDLAAPFATFVELIGGALLILGALTPLVGVLLAANLIGALVIVHLTPVPFVDQGGWELVAALAAGALLIAAAGPGRL